MKDIASYILTSILDEGVQFTIDEDDNNGFITLFITVPQEYMGKVIGKGGKTINSIKNILKIKAIKEGKKVEIELKEQS